MVASVDTAASHGPRPAIGRAGHVTRPQPSPAAQHLLDPGFSLSLEAVSSSSSQQQQQHRMDFQPPYFPPPFSSPGTVSSASAASHSADSVFSPHLQADHYQHYAVSTEAAA